MKRNIFDGFKTLKHVIEQAAQRQWQRVRRQKREDKRPPSPPKVFTDGKTYSTNRAQRRRELRAALRKVPRRERQAMQKKAEFSPHFRWGGVELKDKKKLRQVYKRIARLQRCPS